jgi:hypothetical protein
MMRRRRRRFRPSSSPARTRPHHTRTRPHERRHGPAALDDGRLGRPGRGRGADGRAGRAASQARLHRPRRARVAGAAAHCFACACCVCCCRRGLVGKKGRESAVRRAPFFVARAAKLFFALRRPLGSALSSLSTLLSFFFPAFREGAPRQPRAARPHRQPAPLPHLARDRRPSPSVRQGQPDRGARRTGARVRESTARLGRSSLGATRKKKNTPGPPHRHRHLSMASPTVSFRMGV